MNSEAILDRLHALAHWLGDPGRDLAILGEGNVSAAVGEDTATFWLKASGSSMGTMRRDQFVLMDTARAPEADKATAKKFMAKATQSADDVAAVIFREIRRGAFLILPTKGERGRWRVKRFAPELFFRKLVAMAGKADSALSADSVRYIESSDGTKHFLADASGTTTLH